MRLHILLFCHTSRKTSHLCTATLFSQDAKYNANSQSKLTRENRSGFALTMALTTNISLSTSLSRTLLLCFLSRSLALSISLHYSLSLSRALYPTHFIPPLYLSSFLCMSFSLFSLSFSPSFFLPLFSLFLPPTLTHSLIPTHFARYWISMHPAESTDAGPRNTMVPICGSPVGIRASRSIREEHG